MRGKEQSWREASKKERHRFYLLPGMGGRATRRKRRLILLWSIIAGLIVSLLLAAGLYLLNRSHRRITSRTDAKWLFVSAQDPIEANGDIVGDLHKQD